MLKVILFDVDNTLLSFENYVRESMRAGFAEFGICEYREEMFDVFTRINDGLWHSLEKGEITFEELKRDRWNLIFRELGVEWDGPAFESWFRARLNVSAIPEPGAKELLERLRGRYLLGVASNGPYEQQINRLRVGGMLDFFTCCFISGEIGAAKPSPAFFSAAMERLSAFFPQPLLPEEVMIVGDSLTSDIKGGRDCGMRTCLYNPKGKPVPERDGPDVSVRSLAEVENVLE